MSSLRRTLSDRDRAPAQALLHDADAEAGARQQRGLAPVAEAHALDADVLCEQQRAERPLDEGDLRQRGGEVAAGGGEDGRLAHLTSHLDADTYRAPARGDGERARSEEHTSELQSQSNLVCRLLL